MPSVSAVKRKESNPHLIHYHRACFLRRKATSANYLVFVHVETKVIADASERLEKVMPNPCFVACRLHVIRSVAIINQRVKEFPRTPNFVFAPLPPSILVPSSKKQTNHAHLRLKNIGNTLSRTAHRLGSTLR